MSVKTIAADVGNRCTKTVNTIYSSGVIACETEPPFISNVMEIDGKYYVVGSEKTTVRPQSEDEFTEVRYLVAVARELRLQNCYSAEVILGGGVHFSGMGVEGKKLKRRLLERRYWEFKFEGVLFKLTIVDVVIFAQGYSAVADRLDKLQMPTVVFDLGGYTNDVILITDGVPDMSRSKSLQTGTITCINDIQETFRIKYSNEISEKVIEEVMVTGQSSILSEEHLKTAINELRKYADKVMEYLHTFKMSPDYYRIVFIGGGSCIMRNFGLMHKNIEYHLDPKVNAIGYQKLLELMIRQGRWS